MNATNKTFKNILTGGEFKENNSLNNETSSTASDSLISNGQANTNGVSKVSSRLWKMPAVEGDSTRATNISKLNDQSENSQNEDLLNWTLQLDRAQNSLDGNDLERSNHIYSCDKCDKKFGKCIQII